MTSIRLGSAGTLVATFFDVPGGTAVDVNNLQLTITPLGGGTSLGPFGVPPIVHATLGVYSYAFSPSLSLTAGDYLASWSSDEADASEVVQLLNPAANGLTAGPCGPWPMIACATFPLSTAAITGTMIEVASEVLWVKSGRQFDSCTVTVRPCRDECWGGGTFPWSGQWSEWGVGWPWPYNWNGQWFNMGCGGCEGSCSCTVLHTVTLPSGVSSIEEIRIDGEVLPSSAYVVYDNRLLVRTDGSEWPRCNDLSKADTEIGTWTITFTSGTTVPALGRLAVGELAYELALACVGDKACKLPSAVQSVVRQGVSMTFFDPNVVFADGKLGLRNCDLFLSTFNPKGIPERAHVVDVDGSRLRRQTWP
jgi:hypothetical protein